MFQQQYDQPNQKISLAVIRFKRADFESAIQLSDDEIRKYYDQRKDTFQSPERRKVELVSFLLTDDQKKLPDEEKIPAKKPLADQADSFAQAVMQNPATFRTDRERQRSPSSADRVVHAGTTGQGDRARTRLGSRSVRSLHRQSDERRH